MDSGVLVAVTHSKIQGSYGVLNVCHITRDLNPWIMADQGLCIAEHLITTEDSIARVLVADSGRVI